MDPDEAWRCWRHEVRGEDGAAAPSVARKLVFPMSAGSTLDMAVPLSSLSLRITSGTAPTAFALQVDPIAQKENDTSPGTRRTATLQ
jgi:hypothetical protein